MNTPTANPGRTVSLTAMFAAAVLMAHQLGAKATRDALFLSNFDATSLPAMVGGGAAASIAFVVLSSRLLARWSPSKVMPWAFGLSAVLQLAEWQLLRHEPRLAAVLIYLHLVAFGAVLLSGFWSVTNELLDPHTAKQRFGQIAGAGTAGAILGGIAAERITAGFSTSSVLLLLAFLHAAGAGALWTMRGLSTRVKRPERPRWWREPRTSAKQAFSKAPYLFSLAALVLIGTASAQALDQVFKTQAKEYFGGGADLMRFLVVFHTSAQILSLLMQTLATRFFLERLGLGKTVGSLPVAVSVGGLGALFFPVFPVITGLRAVEAVMRGSLFRSGYELFYTPIPVNEKRPAKSIIDVGMDRLGDAVGSGITAVFLWLGTEAAANRILLTVIGLAAAAMFVAKRLDRGYVQALEKSLMTRAVELDMSSVRDSTTRMAFFHSTAHVPVISTPPVPPPAPPAALDAPPVSEQASARAPSKPLEGLVQRLADLRSGRPGRVRVALLLSDPLDPILSAQVIALLAWDEVSDVAREVLTKAAPRICGQLVDFLLDEGQDFAIRRRIPRVLAKCPSQRAVDGLIAALSDSRFEVRFQSGRALVTLLSGNQGLKLDPEDIHRVVDGELSVSRSVWEGHRLLDRRDPSEQTQFLDEVLRERANASLEHVFTLLALVLPRDPLKVAFRALHTEDPLLRGLALEYLETVLPERVREKLSRIVAERQGPQQQRSGDEILQSLMQSNQSVVLRLKEKLEQPADPGGERGEQG